MYQLPSIPVANTGCYYNDLLEQQMVSQPEKVTTSTTMCVDKL